MESETTKPTSLENLRRLQVLQAIERVHRVPAFKNPVKADGYLPVIVPGGIGDLIISLPVLDRIVERVGPIRVFTLNSEIHHYFRANTEQSSMIGAFPGFHHWLEIGTAPRFRFNPSFKRFRNPEEEKLFESWVLNREPVEGFYNHILYQPQFDNEMVEQAMKLGLNRRTLPNKVLGFNLKDCDPKEKSQGVDTDLGNFITVHDGYDTTQDGVEYRSTKSWSLYYWDSLVKQINKSFPYLRIVQLGGKTSRPIPGVNHDLSGRLSIRQSLNVLANSKLHIDGDSGLVHAAHAFGVKSVVMFGPTPEKFFGYGDNFNLSPHFCGGCWWLTNEWMNKCPLYQGPKCMDSIDTGIVFQKVSDALNSVGVI